MVGAAFLLRDLVGADELGENIVLRLDEAATTLMRLDQSCPDALRPLRSQLMNFLLGLRPRPAPKPPAQIIMPSWSTPSRAAAASG